MWDGRGHLLVFGLWSDLPESDFFLVSSYEDHILPFLMRSFNSLPGHSLIYNVTTMSRDYSRSRGNLHLTGRTFPVSDRLARISWLQYVYGNS
jgi:hypothetical protein